MGSNIKSVFTLGFPWRTQDPFLFCAYHADQYPKGNAQMGPAAPLEGRALGNDFVVKDGWRMYHGRTIPGFPSHPHRGFETVTIVHKGYCDHSDSLGAAARFGQGDVQWMTAGRGVQHSEMFPLLNAESANPLEMMQIWLNLPKKDKFANPYFAMLWHEEIPVVKNEMSTIKVVAGNYLGTQAPDPAPNSWAMDPGNEVAIWTITINAGGTFFLPKAKHEVSRSLYFYAGSTLEIDGQTVAVDHGIELHAEGVTIKAGNQSAQLLLLQGKPIAEPVVQHGPFVMNTQEEIRATMKEYGTTQFGGWPWQHLDNVHPKEMGRFAKYPNGTVIAK